MNANAGEQLVANVVAINLSGRFKGQEVRDLGQAFLHHVVAANNVGLVLGQQVGDSRSRTWSSEERTSRV